MRAVFVVALVFFACVSSVAARTEAEERYLFSSWVQEHGKTYENSDEMNQRFMVWKSNLAFVEKHNAEAEQGLHTYTLGMNHLADLTNHEYRKTFLTYRMTSKSAPGGIYEKSCDDADLPDSVDWRTKGVVTPVKNQGQCGSCWSFSATGSMEGAHALATGNLVSLSEQELVDCVNGGANTCSVGGEMQQGFEYAIQNGMESESDYPYCACSGNQCKFNSGEVVATFSSYQNVSSGDESALKSATANRPTVSVAIDASSMNFQLYSGGVFNYPGCSSTQLDHGVLVAGYGTYSGTDYWLVKNSWGPSWGLSGYIMMSRNANNQCGIATDASFALV